MKPPKTPKDLSDKKILQDVYAFWDRVRGERSYVTWDEIDPVEIPRKALPYIIVVERLEDGDFRYRLTGTLVDQFIGKSPQGRRLSELPLDRCEDLRANFQTVIDRAEPRTFCFPIRTPANRYRETTRMLLPVASCEGSIDMIFGAVCYDDPIPEDV